MTMAQHTTAVIFLAALFVELEKLIDMQELPKNGDGLTKAGRFALSVSKFKSFKKKKILLIICCDTINRRYQRLSLLRVSPFKSKQFKSTQLTQHKSNQTKCWFLRRGENRSTQ